MPRGSNLLYKENIMIKRKAAEAQPKSSGRHELKPTKAQPKSNGRHVLKASKTLPNSSGLAERHATTDRSSKAAAQHNERKLEKFHGVLQEFNFSPKGGIEGFLLHSGGQTVQVNVTADVGFAVVRGIGQNVEATVEPDSDAVKHGKGDHPVYSLVTLTGTDGKALIHAGAGDDEDGDGARNRQANQLCAPRRGQWRRSRFRRLYPSQSRGHEAHRSEGGRQGDRGRNSRADAARPAGHRSQDG